MNTDELASRLKEAAADWQPTPFDVVELRSLAVSRKRRGRRRTVALAALLAAGGITGTVWNTRSDPSSDQAAPDGGRSSTHASLPRPRSTISSPVLNGPGVRPGEPPTAVITPATETGARIGQLSILARTTSGTPTTVRARLSFRDNKPGRARGTAIVVVQPGTQPAASPDGTGSYYRTTRVAISNLVDATSPQQRTLTVTTPASLPPGHYPVLTIIRTVLLPGQKRGIQGPGQSSYALGIIVVTAH